MNEKTNGTYMFDRMKQLVAEIYFFSVDSVESVELAQSAIAELNHMIDRGTTSGELTPFWQQQIKIQIVFLERKISRFLLPKRCPLCEAPGVDWEHVAACEVAQINRRAGQIVEAIDAMSAAEREHTERLIAILRGEKV